MPAQGSSAGPCPPHDAKRPVGPPKDLLMEQGLIMARDLVAQALTTRGIRSKVSAEDRSSDEVYREALRETLFLIP